MHPLPSSFPEHGRAALARWLESLVGQQAVVRPLSEDLIAITFEKLGIRSSLYVIWKNGPLHEKPSYPLQHDAERAILHCL
jgi:hypothetical protein